MHVLPDFTRSLAAFVVVLGVLVFVHELGHYLAARWRGVHVEAFSIGFGQSIARWTDRRGTVWKLAWIPLGGYVKLHGQEQPGDVDPAVRAAWRPGETFHDKPVKDRAIVVAAGPVANFLLAILLFARVSAPIGPFDATLSLRPGSGGAEVAVPPRGSSRIRTSSGAADTCVCSTTSSKMTRSTVSMPGCAAWSRSICSSAPTMSSRRPLIEPDRSSTMSSAG